METWQLLAIAAATVLFLGLRLTARMWIAGRWVDGHLSTWQTGVLLGLIYLAPLLLIVIWALVAAPEWFDGPSLPILLALTPFIAILGGILDLATLKGVKDQLRQKRHGELSRKAR